MRILRVAYPVLRRRTHSMRMHGWADVPVMIPTVGRNRPQNGQWKWPYASTFGL